MAPCRVPPTHRTNPKTPDAVPTQEPKPQQAKPDGLTPHPACLRILVADDSPVLRRMLAALLDSPNRQITQATDGTHALTLLTEGTPFDLAILDWVMPGLTGPEICVKLREVRPNHLTYLILLTSKNDREAIVQGLNSGAQDYVVKPFDENELLARVQIGERMVLLQKSMEQRLIQLEDANQELQAFNRMVAHDLRSPLGALESLADLLDTDYGPLMPAEARTLLHEMNLCSGRMRETIEDLMNLVQASRGEINLEETNLSALVASVRAELELEDPTRTVDWRIHPGAHVLADPRLLRLALENLLRNAWKFSSKSPHPRIELGLEPSEDGWSCYFIRDNGAGFDMKYANRLYSVFQRLHSQEEFPGTGIGLNIVKRVFDRHRGRIWANAAPGAGATFYFKLPRTPQALDGSMKAA